MEISTVNYRAAGRQEPFHPHGSRPWPWPTSAIRRLRSHRTRPENVVDANDSIKRDIATSVIFQRQPDACRRRRQRCDVDNKRCTRHSARREEERTGPSANGGGAGGWWRLRSQDPLIPNDLRSCRTTTMTTTGSTCLRPRRPQIYIYIRAYDCGRSLLRRSFKLGDRENRAIDTPGDISVCVRAGFRRDEVKNPITICHSMTDESNSNNGVAGTPAPDVTSIVDRWSAMTEMMAHT
jgi:hypothetical protein